MNLMMTMSIIIQQYNTMSKDEIKDSSYEEFLLSTILI